LPGPQFINESIKGRHQASRAHCKAYRNTAADLKPSQSSYPISNFHFAPKSPPKLSSLVSITLGHPIQLKPQTPFQKPCGVANQKGTWLVERLEVFRPLILAMDEAVRALNGVIAGDAPKALPKGMGRLTHENVESEITDWGRFQNRRQVGSYAGLTGGVSASGQSTADLSITQSGNRRWRTELVDRAGGPSWWTELVDRAGGPSWWSWRGD